MGPLTIGSDSRITVLRLLFLFTVFESWEGERGEGNVMTSFRSLFFSLWFDLYLFLISFHSMPLLTHFPTRLAFFFPRQVDFLGTALILSGGFFTDEFVAGDIIIL